MWPVWPVHEGDGSDKTYVTFKLEIVIYMKIKKKNFFVVGIYFVIELFVIYLHLALFATINISLFSLADGI